MRCESCHREAIEGYKQCAVCIADASAKLACPACLEFRLHTPDERRKYHLNSGKGYTKETGDTTA